MKRMITAMLVLTATLLLLGMGSGGGGPEGSVPQTEENLQARVTDRSGVTTELSQFSLEGKTALQGKLGSGLMTVFFRNIEKAEFGQSQGEEVAVRVTLKTGEQVELMVRKRLIFYGSTGFGALQLRARDILRIELL